MSPLETTVLTINDIVAIIKELIRLKNLKSQVDDIDHLSNRRVRTVGEQLAQQFALGLARMARTIRERMNSRDAGSSSLRRIWLTGTKQSPVLFNTFFGTNQLSQFMDQDQPLWPS